MSSWFRIFMAGLIWLVLAGGGTSTSRAEAPPAESKRSLDILTRLFAPHLSSAQPVTPPARLFCGVEIQAMVEDTWAAMSVDLRHSIPDPFRPPAFRQRAPRDYRGNGVCDAWLDSEHFRIHYSTDPDHLPPGYPDLQSVRDLAAHLETAYAYHRDVSGMGVAAVDDTLGGGQDLIDCYFYDLDDLFGWAHAEVPVSGRCENSFAGFMAVTTDFGFSEFADQLRLTSEHEYYHLLQFAIDTHQSSWAEESTARNSEFHVWPEIAAPRGILDWVSHPYYPLWSGDGIRKYAPHFWFFLEAVLDRDIVTRIWERCCHERFNQALVEELNALGADLDELMIEFAIWNYFAGHRDDGRHYDPACQVPAVYHQEGHGEYPVPPTSLPENKIAQTAGSNYIRFRGPAAANNLRLTFAGQPEMAGHRAVIVLGVQDWGHRTWILEPDLDGDAELIVPDWGLYEYVTLVVANFWDAPLDPATLGYTYAAEELGQDDGPTDSARLVMSVPNPFHSSTQVVFYAPTDAVASTVRVYDAAGRLVRTLLDETVYAGSHQTVWDGKDQAGRRVPTGLYFVRLESGSDRYTSKVMFVR